MTLDAANDEPEPLKSKPLSEEELKVISAIAKQESSSLSLFLMSKVNQIPPSTILSLRNASQGEFSDDVSKEQKKDMEIVGNTIVDREDQSSQLKLAY